MKIDYQVLDELCVKITDGSHGTPKFAESGYPFITVKNIQDDRIDFTNCSYISQEDYGKLQENCNPRKGDILFSKDGTVGKVVEIDFSEHFIVLSSIAIIRPDPRKLDTKYLKYFLKSDECLQQATNMKTGTAIRRIIVRDIKNLKIPILPIQIQEHIGNILQNADILLKTRKQANQTINKIPQAVFLQMFGDPVTNEKKWKTSKLFEISQFFSGKAWKNQELSRDGIKIVRISNLHKEDFPFWHYSGEIQDNFVVEDGDLLFSWAGVKKSIDVYLFKGESALLNQHIYNIKISNDNFPKKFVYYVLKLHLDFLRSRLGGGVGQFHLRKTDIEQIAVIDPPLELKQKFVSIFEKCQEIQSKQKESTNFTTELYGSLVSKAFKGELVAETN
jgi:type I restriction enzyme, S subunit